MSNLLSSHEQSALLYRAVKEKDIKKVRQNAVVFNDFHDNASLRQCAMDGSVEILKLLIDMGASVVGANLLVPAAAFGHFEMCEFLVSQGENSDILIDYQGGYIINPEIEAWAKDRKLSMAEKKLLSSNIADTQKPGLHLKI